MFYLVMRRRQCLGVAQGRGLAVLQSGLPLLLLPPPPPPPPPLRVYALVRPLPGG
jgi:hypothetical protein